jgi:hypothetical protein
MFVARFRHKYWPSRPEVHHSFGLCCIKGTGVEELCGVEDTEVSDSLEVGLVIKPLTDPGQALSTYTIFDTKICLESACHWLSILLKTFFFKLPFSVLINAQSQNRQKNLTLNVN